MIGNSVKEEVTNKCMDAKYINRNRSWEVWLRLFTMRCKVYITYSKVLRAIKDEI